MKIRIGFVSNSSSEAFICNTDKPLEQIKMELEHLLETYNEMVDIPHPFDSVFEYPFIGAVSNVAEIVDYINYYRKDRSSLFFYPKKGWDIPIDKVIIRSKDDNSVPYELFEIIESAYNATRLHLG